MATVVCQKAIVSATAIEQGSWNTRVPLNNSFCDKVHGRAEKSSQVVPVTEDLGAGPAEGPQVIGMLRPRPAAMPLSALLTSCGRSARET